MPPRLPLFLSALLLISGLPLLAGEPEGRHFVPDGFSIGAAKPEGYAYTHQRQPKYLMHALKHEDRPVTGMLALDYIPESDAMEQGMYPVPERKKFGAFLQELLKMQFDSKFSLNYQDNLTIRTKRVGKTSFYYVLLKPKGQSATHDSIYRELLVTYCPVNHGCLLMVSMVVAEPGTDRNIEYCQELLEFFFSHFPNFVQEYRDHAYANAPE